MVVHYAGKPVRMAPVVQLGLPVIEDAAHAVDSKLDGKYCGTIGTIGVYSFDSVKNVAMGEGGGLTAADPDLVARARALRNGGVAGSGLESSANRARWWEDEIAEVLPKLLPSDIAAAVGLAQLRKLDSHQLRRAEIWDIYQREFEALGWLATPQNAGPGEQHSYFTYLVRVAGGHRDELARYLYENGIYTTLRYHPLHLNPIYGSTARLAVCEQLNQEGLNLPLHPNLSPSDVDKVVTTVRDFGRRVH
jgi:aminotransferase